MAYFKRCVKCGCTLDPAESRICSDCQEELDNRDNLQSQLDEGQDGQVNFIKMIRRFENERNKCINGGSTWEY